MSEIRTDTINNASGDNDSGIDLSTNDVVAIKTANTTAVTVNASQNVGIGTSSPADVPLSVFSGGAGTNGQLKLGYDGSNYWQIGRLDPAGTGSGNFQFKPNGGTSVLDVDTSGNVELKTSADATLKITAGGTSNDSKIDFVHGTTTDGGITFDHNGSFSSEKIIFRSGNNTPHVYMHGTGATSFGTSDASPYIATEGRVVALNDGSRYGGLFGCDNVANREAIAFVNPNGLVGSIRTNGTSTSFNTSSDHRLKENVTADWDATTRLKQLNPVRFNFIADADTTVDGFLAHEVQSVVPEAISGTHNEVEVWKDGEELPDGVSVGDNKLDEDGNTIPVYQGIDQSKLVPLLVKTIQELEARITALENA